MVVQAQRSDEVAVLNKAMAILSLLAADVSCTVARICAETGVTKPAAYRILKTLETGGYVVRDDQRREYSVGPALFGLSRALRSSNDLLQLARPVMQELNEEFDETINIGVVNNGKVVYLDTIESAQRLRSTVHIAIRDHIHSTALGKAILAALPPDEAKRLLTQAERPALTPNTVRSVQELLDQIEQFRAQGFAVDDEENEVGSRCVGAAIVTGDGRPVAALSISAPTSRMNSRAMAQVGRRLHQASVDIGQMLG